MSLEEDTIARLRGDLEAERYEYSRGVDILREALDEAQDERDELRLTVKQLEARIQELETEVADGLILIGEQEDQITELYADLAQERTSYCDRI